MAHKDLEASLSFIPKDRELQQRNAAAVFQACYELLACTTFELKQEYEQHFILLDNTGTPQPAKVVAKTTMEPGSGSAYLRLNFNIIWKKNERIAKRYWDAKYHRRIPEKKLTLEVTSNVACYLEGLGLGTGLVAISNRAIETMIEAFPHYFGVVPNVTAYIVDQSHGREFHVQRRRWTEGHAKALGYQETWDPDTFEKVFPARTHR